MNSTRTDHSPSVLVVIVLTALWLLPAAAVYAQSSAVAPQSISLSLFEREYYDATVVGVNSSNSSLLLLPERVNYGNVKVGYTGAFGDYHRPQQAQSASLYNFCADGALAMGDYYLSGGFVFNEQFEDDVKFTSILNPYRGTPYVIADSTGGNWQKQTYDMWVKLVSPFYGDWFAFGLAGSLDVGRGAKMVDPRPQANSNEIKLLPSITLKFGQHSFGANFSYRRFMENANLMLYNSSEAQKLYLMKGFGQYTYDIFSNTERERRYAGNGYGIDVQYLYRPTVDVTLMLYGGGDNYTEEAMDIEYNKPRKRGRLYETDYNIGADMRLGRSEAVHRWSIGYTNMERSGREIIQVFDPAPMVNAWRTDSEAPRRSVVMDERLSANYSLLLKENERVHRWKFDICATYADFADEYAVMKSFVRYENIHAQLRAERTLFLSSEHLLQASLAGGYLHVWNRQMNIVSREESDRKITDQLVQPDVNYLFQNNYSAACAVMYGYVFRNGTTLYAKGSYEHKQTTSLSNRSVVALWIGYNF